MKNYTTEQTQTIIDTYVANPTSDTVAALAAEFERPVKSIIGKLASEKVYVKQPYFTKTGDPVVTKAELVFQISNELGLEEGLEGLEKAPKAVLQKILANI